MTDNDNDKDKDNDNNNENNNDDNEEEEYEEEGMDHSKATTTTIDNDSATTTTVINHCGSTVNLGVEWNESLSTSATATATAGKAFLAKEIGLGFDSPLCATLMRQLLVRESPGSNPGIVHQYSAASGDQGSHCEQVCGQYGSYFPQP